MSVFKGAVPQSEPKLTESKPAEAKVAVTLPTTRLVKQAEIGVLVALEEDVKRRKDELRARLEEGYAVEVGPLFAELFTDVSKESLSKTRLTEILGDKAKAEEIWGKLGKKEYPRMRYGEKKAEPEEKA